MGKNKTIWFSDDYLKKINDHTPKLATFSSVIKFLIDKGIESIEMGSIENG